MYEEDTKKPEGYGLYFW